MAIVGKKFPNLNVDAMNEMGDTFKVNVLEEAINNKKKVLLFWYRDTQTTFISLDLVALSLAMFSLRSLMFCSKSAIFFWASSSVVLVSVEAVPAAGVGWAEACCSS